MKATLPISRLIKIGLTLNGAAAQTQDTGGLLILGSSPVIDPVTRYREYEDLTAVAMDFGMNAPEYLAAVLWFEQTTNPLLIGRWVKTNAAAQLFGAPLSAAQQGIGNFSGIADGAFNISVGDAVVVGAPVIVASDVAVPTKATYTLDSADDTLSGVLKLQVTGGTAFTVSIPAGTSLAAAVTLLNLNASMISNALVASTAAATLVITGAVGAAGSKTLIDNASNLLDTPVQEVADVVLTGVTTLNGVAAAINLVLLEATCTWNAVYGQFVFTSTATGATASLSFLSAPTGGGTDISALLGCTNTLGNGAYVVPGAAAETAPAAVALFDSQFGQDWFAVTVLGASDGDFQTIAAFIEGCDNYHYHGVPTQEAGVLVQGYDLDIASVLMAQGYTRTCVQFSSTNPYAVVSYLGKILSTDYTGNNTVIDLMYKQEPGITPEYLNSNQALTAESKNANFFGAYNNNTAIIDKGNSCNGLPTALVVGAMNFVIDLQTDLYNALYGSATKVQQTDGGNHVLAARMAIKAQQYVDNGFLAPGYWNGPLFGTLVLGQFLAAGFYVYQPPIANQDQNSRDAGDSVPFQLAAKFSGAVRNVNLAVVVNQ